MTRRRAQRDEHRLLHLADALPDLVRRVEADAEFEIGGQVAPDIFQPIVEFVGDVDVVRARQRPQHHAHHRHAIALEHGALVARPDLGAAHVFQPHDLPVGRLLQDQVVELLGRLQAALRAHGELDGFALDATGRQFDVRAVERLPHVERRQVVRGQLLRIQPEAHREHLLAPDVDAAHPTDRLEPLLEHVVRDLGELHQVALIAADVQEDDRRARRRRTSRRRAAPRLAAVARGRGSLGRARHWQPALGRRRGRTPP